MGNAESAVTNAESQFGPKLTNVESQFGPRALPQADMLCPFGAKRC
jgi:hypothetical protein